MISIEQAEEKKAIHIERIKGIRARAEKEIRIHQKHIEACNDVIDELQTPKR